MLKNQILVNLAAVVSIALFVGCRDFSLSPDSTDNPASQCDQERWLAKDEYVPMEIYPEMIWFVQPEYPRKAYKAGIERIVWMHVLIDRCGNVRQAEVSRSSGSRSLDEAAAKTAYANRFRPGIMHGHPVACWSYYEVMFKLDRWNSTHGVSTTGELFPPFTVLPSCGTILPSV
ncbi:MAG TPA: energy transducer TonB [Candidatus Acidoferrum sp.]|nr:energy transducer TonB [Candidatus Acidoferrum sp.]